MRVLSCEVMVTVISAVPVGIWWPLAGSLSASGGEMATSARGLAGTAATVAGSGDGGAVYWVRWGVNPAMGMPLRVRVVRRVTMRVGRG